VSADAFISVVSCDYSPILCSITPNWQKIVGTLSSRLSDRRNPSFYWPHSRFLSVGRHVEQESTRAFEIDESLDMRTGAETLSRVGTLFPIGSGNLSMGCHHRTLERR
jgi:hypothetical protein